MKVTTLALIFFLSTLVLFAQKVDYSTQSSHTYIYKLKNKEALEIFQTKKLDIKDSYFHTLTDTFSTQFYKRTLPPGHYLFVQANWGKLNVELKSYNSIVAQVLTNERDFAVQVADSLGNLIENAEVSLGKKSVPYDQTTKSYRLKKWNKAGLLRVSLGSTDFSESIYYDVHKSNNRSLIIRRYWRFSRTKIGRVITLPIRIISFPVRYLIRGINQRYWGIRWPFQRWFDDDKELKGYIATNKPKYQQGDTVKVKAYLTKPNGKPLKKAVEFSFSEGYSKNVFKKKLQPNPKGNIVYEFVLGDSLRLDRQYYLDFDVPEKWRWSSINQSIYYEDYQLDEVNYTFKSTLDSYQRNDKVILLAGGKDKNDLTIPDGQIKLVVTTGEIFQFYEDEVYVPDTLWVHEQALSTRGETQIILPDSIFPNVDMNVRVQAYFSNSTGEMHQKNAGFSVFRKQKNIEVRLEDGYLIADYFVNGDSTENAGILYMNNTKEVIQLPLKYRINPFAVQYKIEVGEESKTIIPQINHIDFPSGVDAFGQRMADSIFIQISNPNRIPVNYLIQTKSQIIKHGTTENDNFVFYEKAKGNATYFLKYDYAWSGRNNFQEKTIQPYKKLLNIEVDQPETISPGETISAKISVKNYKNQPAKNVNLTAGAINAQFDSKGNFRAPEIQYKSPKEPFEFNRFRLENSRLLNQRVRKKLSPNWYGKMGLDSLLFYQMRYENEGVFMKYFEVVERDTFYKNVAQFAPYLIEDEQSLPIYLIYCNNELVYWYDVDDDPPYSFNGREGWNTILIRTKEWEYKMDSVWLKNGHKLELAIDVNNYSKSKFGKNIKQARTQKELTDFEKDLLRKRIFVLRTTYKDAQNHIWQSANNIHIFRQKNQRNLAMGPFKGYQNLTFLIQGGFSNTFLFEPGFQYDILKNRERLYQDERFFVDKVHKLTRNDLQKPGQLIYAPSDIKNDFPERLEVTFSKMSYRTSQGNGTYQIDFKSDSSLIAFVLEKNDTTRAIFSNRQSRFLNIQPGKYRFYGFTAGGHFFEKEIEIRENTLLYNQISNLSFQKDTALFNQFFKWTRPTLDLKTFKQPDISYENAPRIPEGVGEGRYVSGCVTDEDGEGLIGANILIRGTANGTVTDIEGCYRLWVPEGFEDLQVSYTGFGTADLTLDGSTEGSVTLSNLGQLDEVVVTGLGVQISAKSNSGNVLTSDEIRNLPTRNINAIASAAAGVSRDSERGLNIRGSRNFGTDYYLDGIRVTDGIPTDIDQEDANVLNLNLGTSGIRTNFSDYAFWKPYLLTDENGEAFFSATFPDNITNWQTFVLGQDGQSRGGVGYANTRAYKKLMAQLSMPRFLIKGDESNIVGRSLNYTNDSFEIKTAFKVEDRIVQENDAKINEALIDKFEIIASEPTPSIPNGSLLFNTDSLKMSYALSMGEYEDGEIRQIPILPKGVEETVGSFHILEGDTTINLTFDEGLGTARVHIESDVLEILMEDLKYLKNYPYGCNEQTASRLTALLLEKRIREATGEPFKHEKAIISAIVKLKKSQNPDGSWGWWSQGRSNIWMTTYVMRALDEARQQNYKTQAFAKGLLYLTNAVHSFKGKDLLNTLQLFSNIGQNFDYQPFVKHLDTTLTTLYDKFALLEIRQAQGLEMSLDSIEKYQKGTIFGGLYWNEDRYAWYNNSIQTTLLAYQIYKNAGRIEEAKRIRQYFLERRQNKYGWRNTIETARILAAVIPDLINENESFLEKPKLFFPEMEGMNVEWMENFPNDWTLSPDQPLKIQKAGGGQIYLTSYQTFQNRKPEAKSDIFEIETHLEQKGKKTKDLEQAEKATLVVQVHVKESADYAMIEVPIPAGCSYDSKVNFRRYPEVHREYFREKTSIFCEHLPVGRYEFRIELEPRFTGKYTLNPAKVEQMYFPVFYGRNEMKKVKID